MVKLRADEHRYLVSAEGEEEALLRTVPGCRFVAAAQAYQLPRQPGTVIALDRLFGEQGWECPADLVIEVAETRGRQSVAAQHEARVSLVGNELSVECAFGDKELVKLVPGYRWSAPQRRWFLPASPLALAMLREEFRSLLVVVEDAASFLDEKTEEEEAAVERARALGRREAAREEAVVEPTPAATVAAMHSLVPAEVADTPTDPDGLNERLERLVTAVEELVSILKQRVQPEGNVPPDVEVPEEHEVPPGPQPSALDASWRETLGRVESDPQAASDELSPQLQLVGEEALPQLRALLGIAASLNADHESAMSFLRKAEEHSDVPLDAELQSRARQAYQDSVYGLITEKCGPLRPISAVESLEEMLLAELVHDSGFDDELLASRPALDLLSFLMDDTHIRAFDRSLADYCRVLHLLSLARGGKWMAAERVVEFLRHKDLTNEGFALGLIALANTVADRPCMEEWLLGWPPDTSEIGIDDLRWIVVNSLPRLRSVGPELAADAALATLGLISSASPEVAPLDERRDLVRLIPPRLTTRRYAEFLAGYQLAEAGQKRVAQDFPGYLQVLANSPLSQSAGHLLSVFVNDNGGGASSTTRRLAEEVFLESVKSRGIRDPQSEVVDLLDMLAESPRGDNLMNQLARWIEEDDVPGAATFGHKHRVALFERAFNETVRAGRDVDSVDSFDRLVRELSHRGELEAVRTLCMGVPTGFRPLQLPVAQALLTLQLEAGEDFEFAAETVLRLSDRTDPKDEATLELKGLARAYPRLREFLVQRAAEPAADHAESLAGRRLLVVGGHEWLRKLALREFDSWGVKTKWLDPDSAKQGSQALDLASGNTDLVIVNTACISHAASGRVKAQAEKAGTRYEYHNSRGVGALLSIAREGLANSQPPVAPRPEPTRHQKRKKLLR